MKKRLLTLQISLALALLALFVFVPLALAGLSTGDGTWEWVHPAIQGNNVNSVSFVNSTTGWAAGSAGVVMKTTDGGTNWTAQTPSAFATPAYSCHGIAIGSGCGLRGVFFLHASTGWAVGDTGTIWKTTDGGVTWADQHPNLPELGEPDDASPPALRSVHFFDASNGVIVGDGFTFFTGNGGTTWAKGSGTGASYLTSVKMLSATSAVAVGGTGAIYKTITGGATWTDMPSGTTSNLNAVTFSTATDGFAVGGDPTGRLLRTRNGGDTWEHNTTSIPTILTGVALPGGDKLVTTGYSGNIRKYTVDIWNGNIDTVAAGLATVSSGTTNILTSVGVAPATTNVFVGGVAGIVLSSGDSGGTWSTKAGGEAVSYFSSSFVDANNGWISGKNGNVIHTTNGGSSWSNDNAGIDSNADLYGINFRNSSLGFAVGSIPGSPNTGVAYKYTSGTWSSMTLPSGVSYLSEVRMSDDTHGWAVGEEGVILGTSDGATWTKTVPDVTYSLNSVDTTASTNGWAVGSAPCPSGCSEGQGSKGIILKYNGSDWTTLPVTEKLNVRYFTAIDMVTDQIGWAVGYHSYTSGGSSVASGRIYKTTDGGANWTEQASPTSKLIAGVSFLNTSTGIAVADGGRIAKTTNGGTSWSIENAGTDVGMNNVSTISAVNPANFIAYASGGNGSILKFPVSIKPTVKSTSPADAAAVVPVSSSITATFSEDMAPASITDSTVKLAKQSVPGTPISAPVNYDSGTKTVTMVPSAPGMDLGTTYIATVTTGVTDLYGNAMNADYTWTFSTSPLPPKSYYWTWYDNLHAQNWVLLANPAGAANNLNYSLSIAGTPRALPGAGLVAPSQSITPVYPGVMGGPVIATTETGYEGIVSQRILWAGNSLEEVLGTDAGKLSNHFWWTWYDQKSPGYTNWVLIANPSGTETVHAVISFTNQADGTLVTAENDIAPGQNWTPTFAGKMGGPVEVKASLQGSVWPANPRPVMASQRVLSNGGTAFNEVPGIPASELYSSYLWTWYDQQSPGFTDWVLIANPNDTAVTYQIKIAGMPQPCGSCTIPAHDMVTPTFPGQMNGPVEVTASGNVIASQRVIAGPSFEEVPGYPQTALANDYHWTWYDNQSPGSTNWVLVANPGNTEVTYQIKIAGVPQPCGSCTIPAHSKVTPTFPGQMNGPVEVTSTGGNVMVSQRVLWNGYFNEVLGTVLN